MVTIEKKKEKFEMYAVPSKRSSLGGVAEEMFDQSLSAKVTEKKKKPQCKYADEDRFKIKKYITLYEASKAATRFKEKYRTIRKSTIEVFREMSVNESLGL